MRILAIDLGKKKSVAGLYQAESGQVEYRTLSTTPQDLHQLILEMAPDRVVIEIGPQAGWVHDLVRAMEIEIQVANPQHEAWRWRKVKSKTDRKDTLKMARLSALNQLPMVHMPKPEVRHWRGLIHYRQSLIKRRTMIKNSIRAILTSQGLEMPASRAGWSQRSLKSLHELALVDDGAIWRHILATELPQLELVERSITQTDKQLDAIAAEDNRVELLKTIPGVGNRLAETLVAVIDDPHRFRRGREVAAYVGLTPRQFQSGAMNRQGGISGQGNRVLRSLLVQIAWLGLRYNPWIKTLYEHMRRGTEARKKIAIIAVARRLLIRCWAMLRDGTRWRDASAGALRLAA